MRTILVLCHSTRTLHPDFKNLLRIRQVLSNNKASIYHGISFDIAEIAVGIEGVQGHGEGSARGDVPAVEEPFEGEMKVPYCGVRVEEDDEFVVREEVRYRVDFGPGFGVAFDGLRAVVFVVVAVDCGSGDVRGSSLQGPKRKKGTSR